MLPAIQHKVVHHPANLGCPGLPATCFIWARDYDKGSKVDNSLWAVEHGWRLVWQFYDGYGPSEPWRNYSI